MHRHAWLPLLLALFSAPLAGQQAEPPSRIAFGSCYRASRPAPIWDQIAATQPHALVLLGDNVYADSEQPAEIQAAWDRLAQLPAFAKLRASTGLLATWDDHDYGQDDGGADFPARVASQAAFLDFLGVEPDSPRRTRAGVYHAEIWGPPGKRVQFIMLDTRYHRSPQLRWRDSALSRPPQVAGPYAPQDSPTASLLGEAQWQWLEEQLLQAAEVRIIGTSIQFLAEDHAWESWSRFPRERERMLRLISKTRAAGLLFWSGDRHHAELSKRPSPRDGWMPDYPIWEVTTSALNQPKAWQNEASRWRRGDTYFETNFGLLDIDWQAADPILSLQVRDEAGRIRIRQEVPLSSLQAAPLVEAHSEQVLSRIALASCNQQDRPAPLWQALLAAQPQLALLLGDNVYADTRDPKEIEAAYQALAAQEGFASLRDSTPILATWDDHDYGEDDSDQSYPLKEESRKIMLDFFGEPDDSPRRQRDGIYGSWYFGPPEQRVQVILLDLRWNRSPWNRRETGPSAGDGNPGGYAPTLDPQATILGEAQWTWLEEQLNVPARLRIVGSSLQALAEGSQWEGWAMMPRERQRLMKLIAKTRAQGVLFVSGDTHWAELSRVHPADSGVRYPLHELTTSGLNQGWEFTQIANPHRVGLPYWKPNWGLIEIDWQQSDPLIRLQAIGADQRGIRHAIRLSELNELGRD